MSIADDMQPKVLTHIDGAGLFPANFLWGASTAAYQIEGATREDGRAPSIWDRFSATPGATYQGHTGDIATDHYHRMHEDITLMTELGLNAYCFSIAWSRVLPAGTGTVNQKGLDFYSRLIDTLLASGVTPLVKLYHWDLPLALEDRGGWLNRDTAFAFADYAEILARCFGDRVDYWITHNEPWCTAFLGYGIGIHAPGVKDVQAAVIAGHHALLSHGLAMPRLRTHTRPRAQLGIALNLYPIYAADDRPETLQGVKHVDAFKNHWFLDPIFRGSYPENLFKNLGVTPPPIEDGDLTTISVPLDFLAVNYYSRTLVRGRIATEDTRGNGSYEEVAFVPESSYTAMGWEVYPEGLTEILLQVNREYAPRAIMVTENGAAFPDQWDGDGHVSDPQRVGYLREHIQAIARALAQGVPMSGYFAWSLMDNFEWGEGYSQRFGLIYVDYPTQRRIVKESGRWYAAFLAALRRS